MKIKFTSVTLKDVSDQIVGMPMTVYEGIAAYYEATDSDGFGNVGVDSGGISPTEGYEPFYSSSAQVEALTQAEIYEDFHPRGEFSVTIDSDLDSSFRSWHAYTTSTMYSTTEFGSEISGTDSDAPDVEISSEIETAEAAWLQQLQERLNDKIDIARSLSNPDLVETLDQISDQTPINI